jgi:hypothetical protein
MALQGQIPIEFGMVFRWRVRGRWDREMVRDFDRSSGTGWSSEAGQAHRLPLWVVEVIDAAGGRPAADGRGEDRRAGAAGAAVPGAGVAVHRGGVRRHDRHPYVDASCCSGDGKHKVRARQAYSFKATGVRAPR